MEKKRFVFAAVFAVLAAVGLIALAGCEVPTSSNLGGNNNTVTVTSVTIVSPPASVAKGGTQNFSATVTGANSPDQGVTWAVSGNDKPGTAFSGNVLNVAIDEDATSLTVTANSTVDTSKSGTAVVTVSGTATVTSVAVTPATPTVAKGGTETFTATVTGTLNPAQTVTWTVTGADKSATAINDGVLTVATDETATTLTVKATSTVDTGKYGEATVTVSGEATVTSVTVNPATPTVAKGGTQPFTATVTGTLNPVQTVTWTVTGGIGGTAFSDNVLTVASGETATTLTVTATSTVDTGKSGTATVTVPADTPNEGGNLGGSNGEGGADSEPIYFSTEYTYSTGTDINPDESTDTAWTLTAGEYSTVYFAVGKSAGDTVTVGGDDAAKVTQAEEDAALDEITATSELAVFAVDTRDLVFDGGARSFTLGDVAVTLNVEPNTTGAALFKVTRYTDEGAVWALKTDANTEGYDEWAPLTGAETLARIDSRATGTADDGTLEHFEKMLDAIAWVNDNAEAQTEYVLRVEKNELLPKIALGLHSVENVVLRLRGTDSPKILKHDSTANISKPSDTTIGSLNSAFFYLGNTTTAIMKKTLILDDNITVEGTGAITSTQYNSMFVVKANAKLVLMKGSTITKFNKANDSSSIVPILILGGSDNNDRNPKKHGWLRIEGGSITDCLFYADDYCNLINFEEANETLDPWLAKGAFYIAKSTEDNPIVFSGNTDNNVAFCPGGDEYATTYDLNTLIQTGKTIPNN
jgi:hypothetical protein